MASVVSRTRTPWPSVLLTGGNGKIGSVVAGGWRGGCTVFDLPEGDALDREALTSAARGHDAVVHLAWRSKAENFFNGGFDAANVQMAVNAVMAARDAGVRRLVLASSVHADTFKAAEPSARTAVDRTPVPDSFYGSSKVFVESLGRHAAAALGLEVAVIRFGGVNAADREPEDPAERSVWLPHRDCLELVRVAATAPLPTGGFAIENGVGESAFRVHEHSGQLPWRPDTGLSRPAAADAASPR